MELYTARYQDQKLITESGLVPVGITLGVPKFKLNYDVIYLKLLAPPGYMFKVYGDNFGRQYVEYLETQGVSTIKRALTEISKRNGYKGLVLLCYEDVTKPGQNCHRRRFAQWWEKKTGQVVEELAIISQRQDKENGMKEYQQTMF